jgi:hypothetical protein
MSRLIGPTGSRRRRRFLLLPVLLAATLALFFVAGAQAVHDLQFQLDGDVLASTTTNVGGTTQPLDWNSFFDASGNKLALPTNFSASGFDKDFGNTGTTFSTADTTTYATGSKDTLPISPGWQCNFDNNVNSKIDIMNAYAAAYTNPANGHEIIYFALERNSNAGDGNVAFWFLQGNVGCSTTGSNAPFTGSHTDGDILVVSAFTNGGAVSAVDAYRWNGGANGSLGTTPVAHGVDCKSQSGGPGDTTCATVNGPTNGTGGTITTPWLTSNKVDGVGHSLRTSEFFEGGLDLTASNLGGRCFNTFIGDTRSSQSLTATLFDFARGVLGECSVSMTTTPSTTTTSLGDNTAVTDSADVVGSTSAGAAGPTPTGTVTFFLCSPAQVTNGGCEGTNGTQVGSPVTLTEKVPGTGTATSANARSLITGIGTWCFRAHYIAAPNDANYPARRPTRRTRPVSASPSPTSPAPRRPRAGCHRTRRPSPPRAAPLWPAR